MYTRLCILFALVLLSPCSLVARDFKGTVKGRITDIKTKEPLTGANVVLLGTLLGAASNDKGEYVIANVPVGSFALSFQYLGYERITRTDIMVRPERITFGNVELQEAIIAGKEVVVTAEHFHKEDTNPISALKFNYEEIRRAPGSAGDLSRILVRSAFVPIAGSFSNHRILFSTSTS